MIGISPRNTVGSVAEKLAEGLASGSIALGNEAPAVRSFSERMGQAGIANQRFNLGLTGSSVLNISVADIRARVRATASERINLVGLAGELASLSKELEKQAETPDQFAALSAVRAAETAAKMGIRTSVERWLSEAGDWAFEIATNTGASAAAEAIKDASRAKR